MEVEGNMIFRQYREIILGQKTETRRITDKDTYKVGHDYAVTWKRAKPAVWYYPHAILPPTIWHEIAPLFPDEYTPIPQSQHTGWTQERVLILTKHSEPLWDIDEAGAIAEGILWSNEYQRFYTSVLPLDIAQRPLLYATALDCYIALWQSINGKVKGKRWQDNPTVVVHKLKLFTPIVERSEEI